MAFWNKRDKNAENQRVNSEATAKKRPDLDELMRIGAERRKKVYLGQRSDSDDFGYSVTNPICTSGIDYSRVYLSRLCTESGEKLYWLRAGSVNLKECNGVNNVIVDHYYLFLNGNNYGDIYICPYAHNSQYAPKGMILAEENNSTLAEGDLEKEAKKFSLSIEKFLDYQKLQYENKIIAYKLIFTRVYDDMLSSLSGQTIIHNQDFELLPALFVTADYACLCANKNRHLIVDDLRAFIVKKYNIDNFKSQVFDNRVNFYGSIIRGKKPRADWLLGQAPTIPESDPIMRCAIALGDILINPECANDYDSAPIILHDAFESMNFAKAYMESAFPGFLKLFQKIYDTKV